MNQQWVWDIFMYIGLGFVGWMLYCMILDKPLLPWFVKYADKKKSKKETVEDKKPDIELKITLKELLGIKESFGDLIELKEDKKGVRTFVGAVKCEPINYLLRSFAEQQDTDHAYEHLIASLTLGPGREVGTATHISSRPIDLGDQLKPYEEAFPDLDPTSQRFAQGMFFPFMRQWQQTVDEFDYQRYFIVPIKYSDKHLSGLDEQSIILKARNEFGRLAGNIRSNYKRMGGRCKICSEVDLYEAIYFSLNKQNGKLQHFRTLMEKEGILSPFVNSDYSRNSYRYLEEETNEDSEKAT